ncbi:DUF58 domain-containing protein [Microbacterium sp. CJ88]|uniref:DUF58 domain-containing protein n=1 Tax=Microbacterium sp. CJ88 TaxID=3445672 RepID=UPI003F655715
MRRVWPLTVRGTGALLLALACFVLASELGVIELVYFGVLLLAVLVAALVSLYLAHRTENVHRALSPDTVTVDRDAEVRVRVGVRTAMPSAPGGWRDTLPKGLTGRAQGVFPSLGSGLRSGDRSVDLHYTVTGVRRGVHAIGPLSVTSSDPFGLTRRQNLLGDRTKVIVVPAVVELASLAAYAGDMGGTQHTTTNQIGQGADNLIARPYTPGDSMRRIHWRATAHADTLMVRQEEQESTPQATVVLDRGALRWASDAMHAPGADPGFERAVSACVSVTARLVQDGYAVDVIDSDGTALAEPIDGGESAEVDDLTRHLATVTTRRDDHLPRLPHLFTGGLTGPVVVITGRFDEEDAVALAPLVHHSVLPVLLAVSPIEDGLTRATQAGWRAAAIRLDDDLGASWATVADRGANRVLG